MYKSRRRPWVKLYCRDWLTSTVRFDLSEVDRSRFIDLLALAGDSRYPGVVCPGMDGDGGKVGYPLDWLASTMRCKVAELVKTLEKLVKSGRISVSGQHDAPVIKIDSWKKYQSEYLRQIESLSKNKTLQSSTQNNGRTSQSSTQSLQPEVEVEVEGEVEVERSAEKRTPLRAREVSTPSFLSVWEIYPNKLNKREAIHEWFRVPFVEAGPNPELPQILAGLALWVKCEQWKDERYIPSLAKFLKNRQWEVQPPQPKEKADAKSHHERRSENTAKAITSVLGRFEEASSNPQRALPPADQRTERDRLRGGSGRTDP